MAFRAMQHARQGSTGEAVFTPLQHQRDDKVFLIVEMAGEHGDKPHILLGIGIGSEALSVGIMPKRQQELARPFAFLSSASWMM